MGKVTNYTKKLTLFLAFAIFPFGQLARVAFMGFHFNLLDLVVGVFAVATLFEKGRYPKGSEKFVSFLAVGLFSLLLGGFHLASFFYLVRFLLYILFFVGIYREKDKSLIFTSLLAITFFVAIFGWLQYFWFPDLRFLYLVGWDDHLFRLTSTLLDPAFTGIVVVFGLILSLGKFLKGKKRLFLFLSLFFLLTLFFTYSRASYLALFAGLPFLFKKAKTLKFLPGILVLFMGILFLLPRPASEGVKLERLHSVFLKVENSVEGFAIFKKKPLLGVGFNNICFAKERVDIESHSCFGLDNSFLLILATTGVVGGLIFWDLVVSLIKGLGKGLYSTITRACLSALGVHALFTNTLFYPWVMFIVFALLGISGDLKKNR